MNYGYALWIASFNRNNFCSVLQHIPRLSAETEKQINRVNLSWSWKSHSHGCKHQIQSEYHIKPEKCPWCFEEVTYCSVSKLSSHMLRLSRRTSKQASVSCI